MYECVLTHVWVFATPWTITHQISLSMEFSRQEILEWVAISYSRGSFQPRDWTHVSCVSWIGRWIFFTTSAMKWNPFKWPTSSKHSQQQQEGSFSHLSQAQSQTSFGYVRMCFLQTAWFSEPELTLKKCAWIDLCLPNSPSVLGSRQTAISIPRCWHTPALGHADMSIPGLWKCASNSLSPLSWNSKCLNIS